MSDESAENEWKPALRGIGAQPKKWSETQQARPSAALNGFGGLSPEAMQALSAAVYTTDADGGLTFYNEAAATLWGYRPQLGAQRFCGSWKLRRSDGSPLAHDQCPMALALQEKRPIPGREAVAERPDRTLIPFISYPTPLFDGSGRLTGGVNILLDISDHTRAAQGLAEREAQLAVFVEHAPLAIAMFDRDMRYLAVSRRFAADYRLLPGAQLVGQSHAEAFPHAPQRWRDGHVRVLAGEALAYQEDQFTHRNGRSDWVRWCMTPWREGNGAIGGAVLFAEVRTEEVEARHALAESEARFRATFENAAVGVVLVAPRGRILRVNDSFARMLGYSAEELTKRTFQDITHPDDLVTNLAVLNKVLSGEANSYCIEKRYIRKDGGVVWASLTVGCVRKPDGAVDYFLSVIEDITARKRSEARFAEINAQLELAHKAAGVGSYSFNIAARSMRITRVSPAIYGSPHGSVEITGQQWFARVHRDDRERLRAEHIQAFKERRPELVNEFRFVRPGGEVRWIEARSLIDYDATGRAQRMTGVYIDVTERRKAEDHKNLLIAELDHRVKNVLACVAAVAQRSRESSKSADDFLDVLNGRINALANTHALLSRSRWEGVNVAELVRTELAFCAQKGSAIIDGPDVELASDAVQPVAMVLHELATNATKYGALSNGHGRISVRWRRPSSGGASGKLVLEWRETGAARHVAPIAAGYGMSVIRDLIPYELGGTVDYQLGREGAECRLEIPAKWLI